ncbi:MAG TPA: HAMP domain-containing sensor histidine kinase [Anaerolineae bacterium]|mgnify:CR=1 FL=1|nr:HAMP domain-containing sensor histidine kinase [Anaerolineae bacterium]HQI84259.1 HAMP domain-containing sensor histidine kinase [Anaerolineae bacterium]
MTDNIKAEIDAILYAWRVKALNVILAVLAVVALPAVISPIVNALRWGAWDWWMFTYLIGYALIVVMALWRTLDARARGWSLLAVGYFVGVVSLMRGGMAASGRLYLLWLPIVASIIVNIRAGTITTVLSLLIYALFTYFVHRGLMDAWVSVQGNPLNTPYWIEAGTALAMFLIVIIVLLTRFYWLQINTLTAERQATAQLADANAQLEEYSRTLEQKVTQRTHELMDANTQLQAYTQELELRNAELDAFAHTVAHDLKNPLSALVGFSSLLESRLTRMSEEQIRANLQRIKQNSYKMTNIIDELLLLSSVRKIDDVKTRPLDMAEIVEEAHNRLADLRARLQADIHMPAEWPTALGYAPWVEEVWVNYLSNAIKYGGDPEGGIPPRIELGFSTFDGKAPEAAAPFPNPQSPISNPQSKIAFWVRDNGPGLSPEDQSKLFAQFERLNQTRAEGHGLGLSIVRRIVEKLHGDVGVASAVGEGSVFWFTLPVAG